MLCAEVILPLPLQRQFTYSVPEDMAGNVRVGARVVIPFGKKKWYSAIVLRTGVGKPSGYTVKPIDQVVDPTPIVRETQLRLWQWIAEYYICTLGEVYKAALPSGLKLESGSQITYNNEFVATAQLPTKQEQILNYLHQKQTCLISELYTYCDTFNPLPHIKKLLDAGALYITEELRDPYKPKTELCYSLSEPCRTEEGLSALMDKLERAPKQMDALMAFLQEAGGLGKALTGAMVPLAALKASKSAAGGKITATLLTELAKKGALEATRQNVSRIDKGLNNIQPPFPLSEAQQKAHDQILELFKTRNVVLLNGVTGSGKTEIYVHLINRTLSEGKQVLYLLPEIALTTQITGRLRRHFGESLGVYHSKFNDAERVELWQNLLGPAPFGVVLGVRSAVMLPLHNLGLIIVDEEHETSYKQYEPAPRYNARDVAVVLANIHGAKVLLGSATPSLESCNNAREGKYGYVELGVRYAGIEMPSLEVVDMKEARKHKEVNGIFSFRLRDAIRRALDCREQVILFQNRRGYAPYVECRMCAWTAKCVNCDVSMTYHKTTRELVCHYCGGHAALPTICPACGNPSLALCGYGTEKIEQEVKENFPEARVVRMDLDTAKTRRAFEKIIGEFGDFKHDILIGTQMISKGLDFERVNTVGILNVDSMLNIPDFRADERAFAMIQQVSGRAGRHGKRGTVFLQTSRPESEVVQNALRGDFARNTRGLLAERQSYFYPPFCRLIYITVRHKDERSCQDAAAKLATELGRVFGSRILGPQAPPVGRVATYYLQRICLKMERTAKPAKMKQVLMERINSLAADELFKGVYIVVDVDPG